MKSLFLKKYVIATGAMLAFSTPASAATIEEIVVTAQFKEQSLQDTPVAITAMNAEMLEARSMTEMYQVAASAPNVTMAPAGATFGSATAAFIRGIGQRDSGFAFEPGVGIYIDDVYYPTLQGSMFDLLDLDRVEVLRGPQGTLSGKNSIGGSVKMFSRKPDGEGGGYFEVTVGDLDRLDFRGAGEFTIIEDTLFARVSASSKHRDGYITRLDYGCVTGTTVIEPLTGTPIASTRNNGDSCKIGTEGGQDVQAVRAALRWLPSDTVEVNFAFDNTEDNSEAPGGVLTAVNDSPFPFGSVGGTISPASASWIPSDIYTTYSTYNNPINGHRAENEARASSSGVGLTVDWEISDNLAFKSITSYRELESSHVQEDGTPLPLQLNVYGSENDSFSQEFRLNGVAFDDRLDWTVGAYYFDFEATDAGTHIDIPYTFLGPGIFGLDFTNNRVTTTKSKSAFLHAIFELTGNANIAAGIRYTDEDKKFIEAGMPDRTYSGDNTDYRLVLDYHFTDDVMAYAQYSTGFKGGGFSTRSFAPWQAANYNPETLDAYELGLKSSLLDNTLRLNASVFFNDYSDKQLTLGSCDFLAPVGTPLPTGIPCALFTNAGDGEFKGIELEAEWFPADGWVVDASVSTLDFEYTKINPLAGIPIDNPIPFAPEAQASLGVQYSHTMASGATLTPRIDVNYSDEYFTDVTASPESLVESATLVNARLTWQSSDKDWSASLFVTNLTEEEYFINHLSNTINNIGLGTAVSLPSRPREWGLSIKRSF